MLTHMHEISIQKKMNIPKAWKKKLTWEKSQATQMGNESSA